MYLKHCLVTKSSIVMHTTFEYVTTDRLQVTFVNKLLLLLLIIKKPGNDLVLSFKSIASDSSTL